MARDGIKTPKDTNFIVGILERENHGGEKAKRKAHDVQRADDRFRQPSKFASVETKKRLWKLLSKAPMVGMTGVEPAWPSSQNWWVTVTLHPDYSIFAVFP